FSAASRARGGSFGTHDGRALINFRVLCIFGSRDTKSSLRRIRASPIPDVRPAQGGRGPRHAGPAPTRRSGGAADDTQGAQEARPTPEPKVRGHSSGGENSSLLKFPANREINREFYLDRVSERGNGPR